MKTRSIQLNPDVELLKRIEAKAKSELRGLGPTCLLIIKKFFEKEVKEKA